MANAITFNKVPSDQNPGFDQVLNINITNKNDLMDGQVALNLLMMLIVTLMVTTKELIHTIGVTILQEI